MRAGKRRQSSIYVLLGLLLVIAVLTGCKGQDIKTTPPRQADSEKMHRIGPSPTTVQLTYTVPEESQYDPAFRFYFPQVAEVTGGTLKGELLGFLWSNTEGREFSGLYLIDPIKGTASLAVDPEPGYEIGNAASDGTWLAWTEKTRDSWKLFAKKGKEKQVIDEGLYFEGGGTDYPSVSLFNGVLVYNTSTKQAKNGMVSQVVAVDLTAQKREVLHEITGTKQYLGPPSIYENFIVWHRGEWTRNLTAEVYLYDLTTKKMRQLSSGDPAVTPVIWGRYVAWATYSPKVPEAKNIILYDLTTGATRVLTDASASNHLEYWHPTICHGVVTWSSNANAPKPEFFVVTPDIADRPQLGEKHRLASEGEQAAVYGSWFTWRNPGKGLGTYVFDIPIGDLTGLAPEKAFTAPPLPLDTPLTDRILKGLSPPQVLALYFGASQAQRFDLYSTLLARNSGVATVEQYVDEVKRSGGKVLDYCVSGDYLVKGDTAFACLYRSRFEQAGEVVTNDRPRYWGLTREDGAWRVVMLGGN